MTELATMNPTLHLLGIPHTVTRPEYSHCAYTGKVLRFAPMMRSVGYQVIHYGVAGAASGADAQVDVMTRSEQEALIGRHDPRAPDFIGDGADTGSPLYLTFNQRLGEVLKARVRPSDGICLPFGHAHQAALADPFFAPIAQIETGIGYPTTIARFRIFESEAWYHWHLGRDQRHGDDYNWVIPNYFDSREWAFAPGPGEYALYFGRICDIKGLPIVVEMARARPDLRFVICGQGDPHGYLTTHNIEYHAPVYGSQRSDLIGGAMAVVMPTRYVEPFGGVAVEAQLCGVPVLGSAFGSFTETIRHGVTGFRCRTLGDWLAGLSRAPELDRATIRRLAVERYDMFRLAHAYDAVFQQIRDLYAEGWYAKRSLIWQMPLAVAAGG